MDERLSKIESRLEELAESLAAVDRRLQRVESRLETSAPALAVEGSAPGELPSEASEVDLAGALSLAGRTLVGLAGGYLLRAFTSGGYLQPTAGALAGLIYAAMWTILAHRAGARGRALSAVFHGVTSALLALPLIWEATARFEALTPGSGAAALALFGGALLAVAWRWELPALAFLVAVPTALSALFLGGATHAPGPFTAILWALGVATLWMVLAGGRGRSWRALAWILAGFADLAVLLLWSEDPISKGWATSAGVLGLQLALFAAYAGGFVVAVWRGGTISVFTVVQTLAVLGVGFGGALAVARPLPAVSLSLAIAGVLLASSMAAAALWGVERDRKSAALFLSAVATPLLLIGSGLLLPRPAYLWALLTVPMSWLATRAGRFLLHLEAAVFAAAASAGSGLLAMSFSAWLAPAPAAWSSLLPDRLLALLAIIVCLVWTVRGDARFWRGWDTVLETGLWALLVLAGGALVIQLAVPVVAGAEVTGTDVARIVAGRLATLRTMVIAVIALSLAAAGHVRRRAALLVYPVLLAGAVKLLAQDFPAGSPTTLFLALAFYGGALIAAPRLARRRPSSEAPG